jgi:hypothetical protein
VVNFDVTAPPGADHTRIDLADEEAANLLDHLPAATAWLEAALRHKGNRVLVHCHAGERLRGAPEQQLHGQCSPVRLLVCLAVYTPAGAP